MNWSVFTAVLNDIQEYFKKQTPVTLYIPVVAFMGASFLVYIAVFGLEAPLAFWLQLSLDIKAILVAVVVFTALFLAFLASHLRILVTQLYQGLWPGPLANWRRRAHLRRWTVLNEQLVQLVTLEEERSGIEKEYEAHMGPFRKEVYVPIRDLPAYHLIGPGDLEPRKVPPGQAKGHVTDANALIFHYTLEPLRRNNLISPNQIRAGLWPGYLEGKSAVSVPLPPHAAMGTKDNVKPGDLVHITLTPWSDGAGTAKVYRNVLVLDVESAKEVVPAGVAGSVTRDLVVLVVALDTTEQPRFAELLGTCEVSIVRPMAQIDTFDRWLEGREPRLFPPRPDIEYDPPPCGVAAGDIVDITIKPNGNDQSSVSFDRCLVYDTTADPLGLKVAIPTEQVAAYDSYKSGKQDATATTKHSEFTDVPFLAHRVKKDQVLLDDDLYYRDVRVTELPAGALTDNDELINHRAVEALAAGKYVRKGQVEKVTWLGGALDGTRHPEELPVGPNVTGADRVKKGQVINIKMHKSRDSIQKKLPLNLNVQVAEGVEEGQVINIAMKKGVRKELPVGSKVIGADKLRVGQAVKIVMTAKARPHHRTFDGCLLCNVETDENGDNKKLVVVIPHGRVEPRVPPWPRTIADCHISLTPGDASTILTFADCFLDEKRADKLVVAIPNEKVGGWPEEEINRQYYITVTPGDPTFEKCFVYDVKTEDRSKVLVVAIPNEANYPANPTDYKITVKSVAETIPVLNRNVPARHLIYHEDVAKKFCNVGEVPADAVVKQEDLKWHYAKEKENLEKGKAIRRSQLDDADRTLKSLPRSTVLLEEGVKEGHVIHIVMRKRTAPPPKLYFGPCFLRAMEGRSLVVAVPDGQVDNWPKETALYDYYIEVMTVKAPVLKRDLPANHLVRGRDLKEGEPIRAPVTLPWDVLTKVEEVVSHYTRKELEKDAVVGRGEVQEVNWSEGRIEVRLKRPTAALSGFWLDLRRSLRRTLPKVEKGDVVDVRFKPGYGRESVWFLACLVEEVQEEQGEKLRTCSKTTSHFSLGKRGQKCGFNFEQLLTLWIPREQLGHWPSKAPYYDDRFALLPVGSCFNDRLQRLRKRFKRERKRMDSFMTRLLTDQWQPPDLGRLRTLANDVMDLRRDMKDFIVRWPGVIEDTDLDRSLKDLVTGQHGFGGLGDLLSRDLQLAIEKRYDLLDRQIYLHFPGGHEEEVMPTTLGNILKAAERYPYDNYRIVADIAWPRLKDVLQGETTKALADSKSKLDMLLLTSFLSWLFWPLGSLVLVLWSGKPWAFPLCFIGAPLLAWLSYKAAIQAALDYGENLKSIYDLHRWNLLKEFNLDVPKKLTLQEERRIWEKINVLIERRTRVGTPLEGYKYEIS